MKYSFFMNADDYTKAFRYKLKKCRLESNALKTSVVLCLIALVCFAFAQQVLTGIIYFVVLGLFYIFISSFVTKNIKRQFLMSPVLRGRHTLCIYDEGLEIINGYEKIFTPWESLFDYKEDDKRVIIMPSFRKGLIVINKQTENSGELDAFLTSLKAHMAKKEGAK